MGASGYVREGGGSLNTQYSMIDPRTPNPETQTYNTNQGFGVQGAMSGRGVGHSTLDN